MKGELFDFKDWEIGKLEGFPTVFSVGNVVTGKGNIVASRKHAAQVSQEAIEFYLGVADEDDGRNAAVEARPNTAADAASALADQIGEALSAAQPPSAEQVRALRERVAARQREVGFEDYKSWREKVGPPC